MAERISKKELKDISIKSYSTVRKKLETGDLLFCSGNYKISRAIQIATDSPWSHVGMIFRVDEIDSILLMESVEDLGVRLVSLSKYLNNYEKGKPYKGEIFTARINNIASNIKNNAIKHGVDKLSLPYDHWEIFNISKRIATGKGKWKRDKEYICSELVYECFEKAGKKFEFDKRGFVSPENIWNTKDVKIMDRIL